MPESSTLTIPPDDAIARQAQYLISKVAKRWFQIIVEVPRRYVICAEGCGTLTSRSGACGTAFEINTERR